MSSDTRYRFAPALLLLLVALLAYANSFRVPFMFDDLATLVHNPHLRTILPVGFWPRWLVWLSFQLNYALHAYHVVGYHVVNLAIHMATGLFLYGIVRCTLKGLEWGAVWKRKAAPLAWTVAACWLAHPLQTESVTYICQRYESMMGLFMMATLYVFIRSVEAPSRMARRLWADLAIVICALGMGTKEVIVVTPLIVWLYDVCFVGRSWIAPWRERRYTHIGLFLTLGILFMLELHQVGGAMTRETGLISKTTPLLYLATQTEVILHYLRLSLLPRGLCLDYAWPIAAHWGEVWPEAFAVTALGIVSAWGLWRRHALGFIGAVFFLVLAPTSSVLPVPDAAFEHRMYIPLACVVAVIVLGGYRLLALRLRAPLLCVMAGALVVTLIGLTLARNHDYRSELAMWHDVVAKQPGNLRARNDLAIALAESGRTEEAARTFEGVLAAIPQALRTQFARGAVPTGSFSTMSPRYHFFRAHANYGRLLAQSPDTRAAAIRHYVLALRASPRHPVVEGYLRTALRDSGVPETDVEAEMMRRILAR